VFKVNEKVVHRDGLFYVLTVVLLLTFIFYVEEWSIYLGLILLATYGLYIIEIFRHGSVSGYIHRLVGFFHHGPHYKHRHKVRRIAKKINLKHELLILFLTLVPIIVGSYFLVESAVSLSGALGIPLIIIAFVVIAATTSLPDTVVSVVNAKKGDVIDASSNVFGSNVFDILVGLGLPVTIAVLLGINVSIGAASMGVVFGLLASTVVVLYMFAEHMILTKPRAILMLLIYVAIVAYVITLTY
jgi:cation:H+ antiporter